MSEIARGILACYLGNMQAVPRFPPGLVNRPNAWPQSNPAPIRNLFLCGRKTTQDLWGTDGSARTLQIYPTIYLRFVFRTRSPFATRSWSALSTALHIAPSSYRTYGCSTPDLAGIFRSVRPEFRAIKGNLLYFVTGAITHIPVVFIKHVFFPDVPILVSPSPDRP